MPTAKRSTAAIEQLQSSVAAKRRARLNGSTRARGESRTYHVVATGGSAILRLLYLVGLVAQLFIDPILVASLLCMLTIMKLAEPAEEDVSPLSWRMCMSFVLGLGLASLLPVPQEHWSSFALLAASLTYAWSARLVKRA